MEPDIAGSPDWANLGRKLRDARGSRSAKVVSDATGVAPNTITAWEHGRNTEVSPALYKLIEYYGWPPGALARVLAGGEPFPTAEVEPFGQGPKDAEILRVMLDGDSVLSPRQKARIAQAAASQARRTV